tara:strand:+ start:95 stop:196 length:102 start_codon:yes stop_codon:yes gene_type:complete
MELQKNPIKIIARVIIILGALIVAYNLYQIFLL